MSPPEKIRIEDLRDPVLTEIQKIGLAHGEKNPVELTKGAVLGAAVERTGLEDFGLNNGVNNFEERLALWLSEVDEDPERTAIGRSSIYNDCVRYASNRLLINDLLTSHPASNDQAITNPTIVSCTPRSGTTRLVT